MALGSQNTQKMSPAQFVGQFNPQDLVRPGNYSQPNFDYRFDPFEYTKLVQDAMQKQAAFESAYQAKQNNMGWDLVDQIQSTLDKGAVTAQKMAELRRKNLETDLYEEFGRREALAKIEGIEEDTLTSRQNRELESEFGRPTREAKLRLDNATADKTRKEVEHYDADAESLRASRASTARANDIQSTILEKTGLDAARADIDSKTVNTDKMRADLTTEAEKRQKEIQLTALANQEMAKIDMLYQQVVSLGDVNAVDKLDTYAFPAELFEAPDKLKRLREMRDKAFQAASGSQLVAKNKLVRRGWMAYANQAYLEGPNGALVAAKVTEVLRQTQGQLGPDQIGALLELSETYEKKLNPKTKLRAPSIVDIGGEPLTKETYTLEMDKAKEEDRAKRAREPLTSDDVNAFLRAWTVVYDKTMDEDARARALAVLTTLSSKNPEILDPNILFQIKMEQDKKTQKPGTPARPNATRDNKANFNKFE